MIGALVRQARSRRCDDDHEDMGFVMTGQQTVDGQVKFDYDAERQSGHILVSS